MAHGGEGVLIRPRLLLPLAVAGAIACNSVVKIDRPLPPPPPVRVSTDLGVAHVVWSAVAGAVSYDLFESTSASWAQPISPAEIASLTAIGHTNPYFADVPLRAGELERFSVIAYLDDGRTTDPSRPVQGGAPADVLLGRPLRLFGAADGAQLGLSLAAGDVNGDGRPDLIAGQPLPFNNSNDKMAAFVEQAEWLDTSASLSDDGTAACATGWSTAYLGDLDGDGFGDVVNGCTAIASGSSVNGELYGARGAGGGLAATQTSVPIPTPRPERSMGWELAALGDTDADGHVEVAVAVPYLPGIDRTADAYGGSIVFLENQTPGDLTKIAEFDPDGSSLAGDELGAAMAVRSPGVLAVGEPDHAGSGRVKILQVLGSTVAESAVGEIDAPAGVTGFGRALARAGQVDGTSDELLVGATPTSGGLAFAFLYSGTTEVWKISVQTADMGAWGHAVRWLAGGGDVNGDGYDEILVGEPAVNGHAGRVSLYFGGGSGPDVLPDWSSGGEQAERLGDQVMLADVDGDGIADVVASGTEWERNPGDPSTTRGEIRVWRGSRAQGLRVDAGGPLVATSANGHLVELSGASYVDPRGDAGPYAVTVDWGEGTGDEPQTGCTDNRLQMDCLDHYFLLGKGLYEVRVRVTAADGRYGEATTTVEVR